MKGRFTLGILLVSLLMPLWAAADPGLPDQETLRSWVQEMIKSPRGPFKQIRWFCNDGAVLAPKEYACKEHGGGIQHGEWTERVKLMRDNGYYIANVFADIKPDVFMQDPGHLDILKQMILEQFLIGADDGWIFRRARYNRGALQAEDENRGGRKLLLALFKAAELRELRFVVLREAVRFLPHGRSGAPISEMRQLALTISEMDKNFETLRTKIHIQPELGDAEQVRAYAKKRGVPELLPEYERLASIIEEVYQPRDIGPEIASLARSIKNKSLRQQLSADAEQLADHNDPEARFAAAARLMTTLRDGISKTGSAPQMLALMDISLVLEGELFRSGNQWLEDHFREASRRQRLSWLKYCSDGLYGIGLISARQRQALLQSLTGLMNTTPRLIDYKTELEYAARAPDWADRILRFNFAEMTAHFEVIEPLTRRYLHDRLRGSLLLLYSQVLESLMADADRQFGIANTLFGQPAASGLHGLNAGLARGILRMPGNGGTQQNLDRNSIYVLPATTEDLALVAGIITAGKGNILSHVQLLARNLGIPNVAVDKQLLPQIESRIGKKVVLAVSAGGIVELAEDGPQWDSIFADEKNVHDVLIRPDLNKLDLDNRSFIPLQSLRVDDSGRVAGPKGANLGELKHHFPQAVTEGLVIPFGFFRALLEQPIETGGRSVFSWMQAQYKLIRSLKDDPDRQSQVTRDFLERMQDWILNADPGDEFRAHLRAAMAETFGADGTYGVFVRSDTNMEDLPGFTGAGLNLTVPNVVGFDNVLTALNRVWASPFTERAYEWRQAYMENPEHVYVSVLLLKSVPSDKSGVLVTADVDTGRSGRITVAVNEGVSGAVSGQTAEELRINTETGVVRLMAQATEPYKQVLLPQGGIAKIPASGTEAVLRPDDIAALTEFARSLPRRFPKLQDAGGDAVPADIEFGFYRNKLVLFQIRPFLESSRARKNLFLNRFDEKLKERQNIMVDIDQIPEEEHS